MSQLQFTLIPALAYMLVASPETYKLVRSVAGGWVATPEGTAKLGGLVLHAIVFVLLVTLLMRLFPVRREGLKISGCMWPFSNRGCR